MHTTSLALAVLLAATGSAFDCSGAYFSFYNRGGNAMSYQRLDPAIFPGSQSPHLHSFDGGNALSSSMSFATTQESTCTTARIKPDKSLYWRPTLYWNGNNTGFYRVPDQFLKIYYKFGDAGNVRANVTEFPENFRMIAGSPLLRSDDGSNAKGPNVRWACHTESEMISNTGFPTGFTSCKNGFASEITFPACWNGNDINPSDPTAHMAWPSAGGTGIDACPEGFKHSRFPTIFIEFWYDISSFDGQYSANSSPWVLSNGDSTGYGFHADFFNGWERGVLAKATAEEGYCNCGCGCGNDQMKTCFGAENVNDDSDEEFKSCSANPEYGGEDISPLDKLPGCNPIQSGPAMATVASGPDCIAAPTSNGDKPSATSSSTEAANETKVMSSVEAADKTEAPTSTRADEEIETSSSIKVKEQAEETSAPSISMSIPDKEADAGYGSEGHNYASPSTTPATSASSIAYASTATALSDSKHLSPIFDVATDTLSGIAFITPTVPEPSENCQVPVTITITPTVYVTAGAEDAANTTDCAGTVYTTVTQKTTVTVPAPVAYHKHKRHAHHYKY